MKKIILFGLMALGFGQANAQDAVLFKMQQMPNHKYTSEIGMGMDIHVNMTGNQAILDKLKAKGVTMPVAVKLNISGNMNMSTGKAAADNSFPVMVALGLQDLSIDFNGQKIEPLKGKDIDVKVFGHNEADGTMVADSSFVNGKKDTARSSSNMLSAFKKQVKFPDHPLKVGDSFTHEAPINLPSTTKLGINATKTLVKTTYKLISIADGKAYFDVAQDLDIEMTIKGLNASITGGGTGKLVYSIKDSYPLSLDNTVNMKLKVTAGTMIVDGTADITINSKNTISQ